MRIAYLLTTVILMVALPVTAQTENELRQQLEAQKAINEQLRKRVERLEGTEPSPMPALRSLEQRPIQITQETPEATTAIQEALVSKGLVLLPPGSFRIGPAFDWVHARSDFPRERSDNYTGSLTIQAGLPKGMMLTFNAPYSYRDTDSGSSSGVGDLYLALSKTISNESESMPSLVASLGYSHNNGKDPFGQVPIGFGFRVLSGSLSALKRFDPFALYGSLSYSYAYARNISTENFLGESSFNGRVSPGDSWGYRLGTSLAATPQITLDASVSGSFVSKSEVRSSASGSYKLPDATVGFFNLGSGFVITKNLSLLINASAGVTKDSPDLIFSISLPYRF